MYIEGEGSGMSLPPCLRFPEMDCMVGSWQLLQGACMCEANSHDCVLSGYLNYLLFVT